MVKIPCRYSVLVSAFCPETTLNSLERMREPGSGISCMTSPAAGQSCTGQNLLREICLMPSILTKKIICLGYQKKNWEILPVLSGLINKFY